MFSLPFIIAQLYPDKKQDELQKFVDVCVSDGREYYHRTWSRVKPDDLDEDEVKYNLIRTLYQSQQSYYGAIEEVLRSLENWSNGALTYGHISKEDNEFYQRYYCFLGWLNFPNIQIKRQLYLLQSRFLVMAAGWDVPIYTNVQDYFTQYAYVAGFKDDARMFYEAIERNRFNIGVEGKLVRTVGEWVDLFNKSDSRTFENRVDEYFEDNLEVDRMGTEIKEILNKIFTLYYGLKGGFIWREIKDVVPGGYEPKKKKDGKDADEYYLELLAEADEEQFSIWLRDWETVGQWFLLTRKSDDFVNRLFYIITEKANLENDEQVENLTNFIHEMQNAGWTIGADLLYFDEEKMEFEWNEELKAALKEEAEFLQAGGSGAPEQPQKKDNKPEDLAEGIKELTS